MNQSELNELLDDCPRLFHMAERGAWDRIREHGLLSTSALLDLYGIKGKERFILESERRATTAEINTPGLGPAKIRDQLPMDDKGLRRCLPDTISPQQWYEFLNRKVFFWMTKNRLDRLSNAKTYRNAEHEVLILNSRRIVESYREKIWLCPINSGCTKPYPWNRDYSTFARIADYPYQCWRKRRKRGERVVELCIDDGVPNVTGFVERVYVVRGTIELFELTL